MKARDLGQDMIRLINATGGYVHLETYHGIQREGKLSGWSFRVLTLNGRDIQFPEALQLNGDPSDEIKLSEIRSIEVQDPDDEDGS